MEVLKGNVFTCTISSLSYVVLSDHTPDEVTYCNPKFGSPWKSVNQVGRVNYLFVHFDGGKYTERVPGF